MEKESKSCTGVLLRADLTGHGQFSQSADFCQKGWDGLKRTPVHDFNSLSIMSCYIISNTYQKIGDLFCSGHISGLSYSVSPHGFTNSQPQFLTTFSPIRKSFVSLFDVVFIQINWLSILSGIREKFKILDWLFVKACSEQLIISVVPAPSVMAKFTFATKKY